MQNETPAPETPAAAPGPRRWRAVYTAALAGGLVLGGVGIAAAQTDTTSPPTTVAPDNGATPAPDGAGPRHFRMRGGPGGPGGMGVMGMKGALHGEFVVPDSDGSGYRTAIVQRGVVTDVSASSVTVKSDDGFTKTYTVDDNTMVNAGNEGIGDVKKDDHVAVHAFVEGGGDPHAAHIVDETGLGAIREHWHPGAGPDDGPGGPGPTA